MVSALFLSRPPERGGTRRFTIGTCMFGWTVIEDLYRRELSRIRAGQCSRVPKLKQNHIRRDSWTRLNVLPSKVMQVCVNSSLLLILTLKSNHGLIVVFFSAR